jgi:hypothetical protein
MSYVKYERDIVTKYKVELLGWPVTIKFANPSEVATVDDIRKLRQALRTGDCKWMVQTRRQQVAHAELVAAREAAGEPAVKKRKERSDKGKTRGKGSKKAVGGKGGGRGGRWVQGDDDAEGGDTDGDGEQEQRQPPKKKQKSATTTAARAARKLPPAPKSLEFIHDSDDGSEED